MEDNKSSRRLRNGIGEREIFVYTMLHSNAFTQLRLAERDRKASFWASMNSIVLTAFFVEGYLNFLGAERVECWEHIERKLKPKEKLLLLGDRVGFTVEPDSPRFQYFNEVIRVRNDLAHPKKTVIKEAYRQHLSEGETPNALKAFWEAKCTVTRARKYFDEMTAMIEELHKAAGFESGAFSKHATTVGWEKP